MQHMISVNLCVHLASNAYMNSHQTNTWRCVGHMLHRWLPLVAPPTSCHCLSLVELGLQIVAPCSYYRETDVPGTWAQSHTAPRVSEMVPLQ